MNWTHNRCDWINQMKLLLRLNYIVALWCPLIMRNLTRLKTHSASWSRHCLRSFLELCNNDMNFIDLFIYEMNSIRFLQRFKTFPRLDRRGAYALLTGFIVGAAGVSTNHWLSSLSPNGQHFLTEKQYRELFSNWRNSMMQRISLLMPKDESLCRVNHRF